MSLKIFLENTKGTRNEFINYVTRTTLKMHTNRKQKKTINTQFSCILVSLLTAETRDKENCDAYFQN